MGTLKAPVVPKMRDYVAATVANMVLRCASPEYRQFVKGSIEYGLRSAARDESEGRDMPGDWRNYPGKDDE